MWFVSITSLLKRHLLFDETMRELALGMETEKLTY